MFVLNYITTRMAFVVIMLVVQLMIVISFFSFIFMYYPFSRYISTAFSFAVFFYLLKNETSAYNTSWLILVLLLSPIGGIVYLFFGNNPLTKRIIAHTKEHALIAKTLDSEYNLPFLNKLPCGRMYGLFKYVRNTTSYRAYINTESKYYPFGELMFEDMLTEIAKAEKFIFLEYFIIYENGMWNRLYEALLKKAEQGLEIKLIVDDCGSQKLFTNSYIRKLKSQKIEVLRFNPMIPFFLTFMLNRDHRKITVIDGHTAFTGGCNISDEYINQDKKYGLWKDIGVRLKGDAVWSFTLMFIEMWDTFCFRNERINDHSLYKSTATVSETDGIVMPFGDTPLDDMNLSENIYIDILHQSQQYVYIYTPFLIITEKMIHALKITAQRGIDVRIVVPNGSYDPLSQRISRSHYRYLLGDGVKIYEYMPGHIHAKCLVSDDKIAVVGTINLDYRSLYLHFECAALFYNSSIINEIRQDVLETISKCYEVALEKRKIRVFGEIFDSFLHLISPLL